jgi:Raf kinase inhibitor-like YbhB/YbcL family protein
MRKAVFYSMLITSFLIFQFSPGISLSYAAIKSMSVTSDGIKNGFIGDQYGKRGSQKNGNVPSLSLPLTIEDAPEGTVCYAILMTDPNSIPHEWVHWLAVNIKTPDLPENASIDMAVGMTQGKNSFGKVGYGGPTPPDRLHTYVITVYALDAEVSLKNKFTLGQFTKAIKEHTLAEARVMGKYNQ